MGKRYYCDYCNKRMVASPSIRKTHNSGLIHQKIVLAHYQQSKDPEVILSEEDKKTRCERYFRGACKFGAICRFSHYSQEQLNEIRNFVTAKNMGKDLTLPSFEDLFMKLQSEKMHKQNLADEIVLYESNGVTHVFPWTYNENLEKFGDLPPSIKRFKIEDFENSEVVGWG